MMDRRKFIRQSGTAATGLAVFSMVPNFARADTLPANSQYTVQQIIDIILKEGKLSPIPNTVDTLKSGSADMVVTGIVTTMFATVTVIKQAVKLGANFIIAHEPTFYNHADNTDWVKDNAIVKQKQALLAKHNITVWRFHDYIHSIKPDLVVYGTAKKLGWLQYFKQEDYMYTVPQITLAALVKHLKITLNIPHLRIIGDLDQKCARIGILPGAPGGQRQVAYAEKYKPDVLVIGELQEWETAEYIRDQRLMGGKMSLVILGHNFSEDPGMSYLVEWLQPKLTGVKMTHIASGEAFTWM